MSNNYNTQLQSNNTDLQTVLQTLQNKAAGGEQATPEISVNSSNGLITATAGTKSSTHQLAFQPAKTITPSTVSQIAVSSGYYTGGNITVAGDSNLVANNIKSGVSIFGVSGTLVEGGGGNTDIEDSLVTRTFSSYTNDRVTTIGTYAFAGCSALTLVSFPACTTIERSAFANCSALTSVSFPACTSIEAYAFSSCSALTLVSFPACITIRDYTFVNGRNLTSVNFPACTAIGNYAFLLCSALTSVNFPVCSTIGNQAFSSCSALTLVSFPACTTIRNQVFGNCRNLSQFYLTGSKVCRLSNSNAFSSTPYAGYSSYFSGTPYIYVPSSLLTSYQTATNWTYFSSYFSAVEDAP